MDDRAFARFSANIRIDADGCWIWTAADTGNGYGKFKVAKDDRHSGSRLAHRISYEHYIGPIPDGLTIDHLCRLRACVNPEHLEAVTYRENALRGSVTWVINLRKTHCKHEHPFTPENTRYRIHNGKRWRRCMACHRNQSRKARAS